MKISKIIILLLLPLLIEAQTPLKISYQSIVRKADASLVVSSNVSFKFEVLQGSANGTVVYAETQTKSTNSVGFFAAQIGGGNVLSGNFSAIDWSTGLYFLRVSIDVRGGSNFSFLESTQFLAVPYAFHAITADSVINASPANYNVLLNKPANIDEDKSNDGSLNTNQDIAGTKTFSGEIVVSSPTLDTHAVNKAYIDALSQKIGKMRQGVDSIQHILDEVVVDFDGNRYTPVRVGTQIWLEEPLITTHFSNGDPISLIASQTELNTIVSLNDTTNSYYCFAQFDTTKKNLGVLYNFRVMVSSKKICPAGYKVPSEEEFRFLFNQFASMTVVVSPRFYLSTASIGLNFNVFNSNMYGFNLKNNSGGLRDGVFTFSPILGTVTRANSAFKPLQVLAGPSLAFPFSSIKNTLTPIRCIKEN